MLPWCTEPLANGVTWACFLWVDRAESSSEAASVPSTVEPGGGKGAKRAADEAELAAIGDAEGRTDEAAATDDGLGAPEASATDSALRADAAVSRAESCRVAFNAAALTAVRASTAAPTTSARRCSTALRSDDPARSSPPTSSPTWDRSTRRPSV